ncbi:MAG: uracil phosphoribosyltransferase [Planctomycetes bacterium]|nr:uracil phosphoribosyltransferase [Planctomycetota bacterium]
MEETARELAHGYGPRVHLLDNPLLGSALTQLSRADCALPRTLALLRAIYEALFHEAARELPRVAVEVPTRMSEAHPKAGRVKAQVLDPAGEVVVCDVIRAGIVPSQVVFERLLSVLPEGRVRLDHLTLSRVTDASGAVTGVNLSGSKIGGTVQGATLIVPDPMGATGSTLVRAIRHYEEHHGRPTRVLVLPMIVTPEFLRRVLDEIPQAVIYAGRLDRGLSPADVLATPPGTHWDRECGLDAHDYIVPGAGGMGEVLNNSWC